MKKKAAKKAKVVNHWQKQADHFQKVLTEMQAIIADPATTAEDRGEAEQTVSDMTANLARLAEKHGVTPKA